jgi:hypothetical protein
VTRPRAADDFATIRMRLEELRRERAETLASEPESEAGPQPRRADGTRMRAMREAGLLPSVRRSLSR